MNLFRITKRKYAPRYVHSRPGSPFQNLPGATLGPAAGRRSMTMGLQMAVDKYHTNVNFARTPALPFKRQIETTDPVDRHNWLLEIRVCMQLFRS